MQVADNWARRRRDRCGFSTNMGTVMVVHGYVIEIKKTTSVLQISIVKKCHAIKIGKDSGES
jgi:hypothetical protein